MPALLEGVIVLPGMIAVLGGTIVFARFDQQRLEVAREARVAAFVAAHDCASGPDVVAEDKRRHHNLRRPDAPPGVDAHELLDAAEEAYGDGGDVNERGFSWSTEGSVGESTLAAAGAATKVKTHGRLTMMCNEPPYDGRVEAIARAAIEKMRRNGR